ncbi:MAG: PAS domain S-box protein [Chloroflexi bacterium]|nr:PAS domain S-box protein [Chloroflexota bacterium]
MFLTDKQRDQLLTFARDEAAGQELLALVEGWLADARAREQAFADILKRDWNAIFTIDSASGAVLDAAGAAEALYGYSRDEMLRMNHTQFSAEPTETRRAVTEVKTSIPVRYHRHKNGTVLPVEIAAAHLVQGGRKLHVAAIRSHATRQPVEIALYESEERYRRLVELLPIGVVLYYDGKILFANGAATRILKVAHPGELIGQSGLEFVHPDYAARTRDLILRLAANHQPAPRLFEEKLIRRDGVTIDVEVAAVPFPYQGQTAVMIVFEDVTERIRAQRQAFDLAVERERLKILRNFVLDASHEFRTPLAIITTSLYLYARTDSLEKRQAHGETILQQVQRLTKLLDDMLTLSRLDSMSAFQTAPVALNQMLQQLVAQLTSQPGAPQITLETDDRLLFIEGNEELLHQAFARLLSNAVRFTPPTGSVHIQTVVTLEAVIVEIRDTGIGMTADTIHHIFERFYREDRARQTPGFGLGLPIAREVIEGHGGYIEVESEAGQGSLFRVRLPQRQDRTA